MRVVFVGASGTIGRQVVPLLKDRFDLLLCAHEAGDVAGLRVVEADITRFEPLVEKLWPLLEGADALVNCATADYRSHDGHDRDSLHGYYERCLDVNARGTYHLLEAAARAGVPKVVLISSMTAVLGEPAYEFIERDARPRPRELYACTKLFGEMLGESYARRDAGYLRAMHGHEREMQVLCLRLGQPFPALVPPPHEQSWRSDAHHRGMMADIRDIARAIACALQSPSPRFGVFPIVSLSDVPRVDISPGQEIGWQPTWKFSSQGVVESVP